MSAKRFENVEEARQWIMRNSERLHLTRVDSGFAEAWRSAWAEVASSKMELWTFEQRRSGMENGSRTSASQWKMEKPEGDQWRCARNGGHGVTRPT
jgi:hypothetical protein